MQLLGTNRRDTSVRVVQRLERQQTQLELDTLRNRKPMKTVQQDMLDVVMLLGADQ